MNSRILLAVAIVVISHACASASMQIIPTFVAPGNNGSTPIPAVNNYKNVLEGYFNSNPSHDIDALFNNGANVGFTSSGTLTFFYHGAESGFTNRFVIGATNGKNLAGTIFNSGYTDLYQENIAGTPTGTTQNLAFVAPNGLEVRGMTGNVNNVAPTAPFSVAVTTGDTFASLGIGFRVFDNNGIGGRKDALAGEGGFGVFYNTNNFNNGNSFLELLLGYDDNGAGPDDNHDDMIIRVVFTPKPEELQVVPELASVATWATLLVGGSVWALCGSRRRVA